MEHWKERLVSNHSESFESYVKQISSELKKIGPVREKSNIQAASTQRVLDMTDEELEVYRNRPLPTPEQCKADPLYTRSISLEEYTIVDGIRKSSKNTMGDAWSEGIAQSATLETKERAIHAFSYTPPAELTEKERAKVSKLTEIQTINKKLSFIERVKEKTKNLFNTPIESKGGRLVRKGWHWTWENKE